MPHRRAVIVALIVTVLFGWGPTLRRLDSIARIRSQSATCAAALYADFNGDGFTDQAFGVPNEDLGSITGAGAVNVLYGSAAGLASEGIQFWTQDSPDIRDTAELGDRFGFRLATGDFNGDGFADLAVGVLMEDVGGAIDAGAVNVIYGSATGLMSAGNQFWTQDSAGVIEVAEADDKFSYFLTGGDFNGDGIDDLAIGVWAEDIGLIIGAGGVNVLYGTSSGLSAANDQFLSQGSNGIEDTAEANDQFGQRVVSGDFNGDGFDDLAVSAPVEDIGSAVDAGAVNVIYGSPAGLSGANDQFWSQDSTNIADTAETDDRFGRHVSAGDYNGDGFDDLSVGVAREDVDGRPNAGGVNVLYGSLDGLTDTGNQFWTQNSPDIEDSAQSGDHFGWRLTSGDFNCDGFADLAVGVPNEDVDTADKAGAVNVLYGTAAGLSAAGDQFWTQNNAGGGETSESDDQFGREIAAGDFNGDGFADLAAAAFFEDVGAINDAGAANALYGTPGGLSSAGSQVWTQDMAGETVEAGDAFARALAGR